MAIVKFNLKTACGCTRHFFERQENLAYTYTYIVPIRATSWATRAIGGIFGRPSESWSTRIFELQHVNIHSRSRVEVWYQEKVEV